MSAFPRRAHEAKHRIDDELIQNRQRDILTYRQAAQHGLAVPILGYESKPRRLGVADTPKRVRLSVEFKRPGLQRLSPGHHGDRLFRATARKASKAHDLARPQGEGEILDPLACGVG